MTLCEREQDDRLFKKVKQLTIDGSTQNVHHMTLSPAEDLLIASMDNNQMYSLNLTTNEEVSTHNAQSSIDPPYGTVPWSGVEPPLGHTDGRDGTQGGGAAVSLN